MMLQLVLAAGLALDLAAVKSEPNLEKRSELALVNANAAMDAARVAYDHGDVDKAGQALDELKDSGKSPRGNGHYKHAEKMTHELLRRLESFRDTVSAAERDMVEVVHSHVSEVHDDLLDLIMSNGRKRK